MATPTMVYPEATATLYIVLLPQAAVIKKKQQMSCMMFANQECHARFDTPLSDRSEICLLQRRQDVICNPVLKHT